jgi:putative glutamine amidotransferase
VKTRIGIPVRSTEVGTLYEAYSVQKAYIEALQAAHAEVVLLYPKPFDELKAELQSLDGLMIVGGKDVHPSFYGEQNVASFEEHISIDQLDIDVIRIAIEMNKEILGICRGLQVINVALGGTLHQHIDGHRSKSLTKTHSITVLPETLLSTLIDTKSEVNSFHHQAIKTLAPFIRVSAMSEDGIIEAIEAPKLLAVQWHPERMRHLKEYSTFFEAFVKRASQ